MSGDATESPSAGSANGTLLAAARASEWWEYKLVPPLAIAYATCLMVGASPWQGAVGLIWLIAALVPGGVFVSVLNDLTDRADDAKAGKKNRLSSIGPLPAAVLIVVPLGLGMALAWTWRDDIGLVLTYLAAWVAFLLYSVPPIRLKRRGAAGILCDAIGANVIPALLAVQISARAVGESVSYLWVTAVAIWALMYGLRGILWHQISDVEADRRSETPTFVVRLGVDEVARLARRVLFPLEIAALLAVLLTAGNTVVTVTLLTVLLYLFLLHERIDRFCMNVTIVMPLPRSSIMMQEYYDLFLPLGLLVAGTVRDLPTLVVLAMHLLAFPRRTFQVLGDFRKMLDPQFKRRPR